MYQIKDVATGEFHRNHKEEALKWETRAEAGKFAEMNLPGDLDRGVITIVPVQAVSPDFMTKVVCVRAILGTMNSADILNLVADLLEHPAPVLEGEHELQT
jgi:hypothetical protein